MPEQEDQTTLEINKSKAMKETPIETILALVLATLIPWCQITTMKAMTCRNKVPSTNTEEAHM